VQAFGISTGDPDFYLREFKKQLGARFPWLLMDTRLPNPYYQEKFDEYRLAEEDPTLVVLDADGIVRFWEQGQEGLDYRGAFDLVGALLAEARQADAP